MATEECKPRITSNVRYIFDKLPPKWSHLPLIMWHYLFYGKSIRESQKRIRDYARRMKSTGALTREKIKQVKTLKEYSIMFSGFSAESFMKSYFEDSRLRCLKRVTEEEIRPDDVILICCVKDDLRRVQVVLKYHRTIGVKHFVFVDNMSTDGTLEWLLQQDVDVYQTNERFHAGAKAAWVQRLWDTYGYNRWYLILDSDELFTYAGIERHPVHDLIKYAQKHGIERVRSILLDMYTDSVLFSEKGSDKILLNYRYFDTDSYSSERDYRGIIIRGGARKRIFEWDRGYAPILTKYPLLYVRSEDIWNEHLPLPFKKNFASECFTVLRHYKFISGDKEKYRKNAADGNYHNGSYEYKMIMRKIDKSSNISFYYEGSAEYKNSYSLLQIPFVKCAFEGPDA